MISEVAYLQIDPDQADAFLAAVGQAASQFRAARGCRAMRLERVIEDPAQFRLIVHWESVEAHMVDFRDSPGFARWRELAGPYFVAPPKVEHWQGIAEFF